MRKEINRKTQLIQKESNQTAIRNCLEGWLGGDHSQIVYAETSDSDGHDWSMQTKFMAEYHINYMTALIATIKYLVKSHPDMVIITNSDHGHLT